MYHRYGMDSSTEVPEAGKRDDDRMGIEELERQKRQLGQKLKTLKHSSSQQMEMGVKNNMKKITENSVLMTELNDVRQVSQFGVKLAS